MFCYQCEQTAGGTGCQVMGVCGKDATTANLQDLLIHGALGISMYAHRARQLGVVDREADVFLVEALFATVTNVDFDPLRIEKLIRKSVEVRDRVRLRYEKACQQTGKEVEDLGHPADWQPAADVEDLVRQAEEVGFVRRRERLGDTVGGLWGLALFGLKGAAAYTDHAQILGKEDDALYASFHEALDYLASSTPTVEELLEKCLAIGEINLRAMQILDAANTEAYGHPTPTVVRTQPLKGKAIAVSGHDLKDLEELLKQTEGKGINVYTHGEMLPAHGYPKLKAYKHLVGNYGGAWQEQVAEFDAFPGAILMTTNCIQKPRETYKGRIFTSSLVAWPGVTHIADRDFTPVVEAALETDGFAADAEAKPITVGFGRHAIAGVLDKLTAAIKSGAIRHIFLIGGCDGAKSGRNYYTELAQAVPNDCLILTLACGKYRFNKLDFGEIDGIPRLLDIGQCNDAYSAIQVAVALSEALNCPVNDLPLSFILSWYEQKAVAILLTLLYLGIRNIRLGPTMPACIAPDVLKALGDRFNIMHIGAPRDDLQAILG